MNGFVFIHNCLPIHKLIQQQPARRVVVIASIDRPPPVCVCVCVLGGGGGVLFSVHTPSIDYSIHRSRAPARSTLSSTLSSTSSASVG